MSKIIDFPAVSAKAPEEDAKQIYSLADLGGGAIDTRADLVSVLAAGQGASVEVPFQGKPETPLTDIFETNPYVADWDNQELASLYRAQRLLGLTGISFDVDRGLSDEGDPWFVFIDDTGEVLAHFCRMDGMYHLDSAAQSDLLTGHSLESLVSGFAQRNQPVTHKDRSVGEAQVVYLAGGAARSNVMMHPGVSLAALVWSIYMLSDTLVLPTYGADGLGADLDVEYADTSDMQMDAVQSSVDHLALSLNLQRQGAIPQTAMQNAGTQNIGFENRDAFAAAATTASGPTMGMGSGPSMNAVGLGLSTLAMSYGIHLFNVPLTTVQMAKDVAISVNSLLAEWVLPDGTLVDVQAFSDDLVQAVDRIETSDVVTLAATDKATLETANEAVVVQPGDIVDALVQTTLASDGLQMASVAFEVSHDRQAPVVAAVISEVVKQDIQEETRIGPVATQNDEAAANGLHNLLFALEEQGFTLEFTKSNVLGEQDYIDLMLQTSSDLDAVVETEVETDLNTAALVLETEIDQLADPISAESAAKIYPVFDDAAYDFVVFLMMKQDDAQQSHYNGEVILIDKNAFEVANAEVYARTWSFEDGSILSTVGSKSDFEAFGLII